MRHDVFECYDDAAYRVEAACAAHQTLQPGPTRNDAERHEVCVRTTRGRTRNDAATVSCRTARKTPLGDLMELTRFASISIALVLGANVVRSQVECTIIEPPHGPRGTYVDRVWPGGVVPYDFQSDVSTQNQDRVRAIMAEIESWANVRFVPRQGDEPYWITVQNSISGNSATVGKRAGGVVNIATWESNGLILHELMHALGFLHEQQRADRDQYIELHPCALLNSNYNLWATALTATPYDFESVMHYTPFWGCSSEEAFRVREPYRSFHASTVGTWQFDYRGPSAGDIWSMYLMYGGDPVPGPFSLDAPADGAQFVERQPVTVSWVPAPLADSYRVELDRTPFFARPFFAYETPEASFTLPQQSVGTFYWRVTAINHRGETLPHPRPLDVRAFEVVERCVADIVPPYGIADDADVAAFISIFTDASSIDAAEVDIAKPFGLLDLSDVDAFIRAFQTGLRKVAPASPRVPLPLDEAPHACRSMPSGPSRNSFRYRSDRRGGTGCPRRRLSRRQRRRHARIGRGGDRRCRCFERYRRGQHRRVGSLRGTPERPRRRVRHQADRLDGAHRSRRSTAALLPPPPPDRVPGVDPDAGRPTHRSPPGICRLPADAPG